MFAPKNFNRLLAKLLHLKLKNQHTLRLFLWPARLSVSATTALSLALSPPVLAAPTDGQVAAGAGSISQAGNTTTINQSSQNLAINWQAFSIAANEAVRFNQPNITSVVLNRVIGQSNSQIFGAMSANGQVFILNPNGVLFAAGSQVNVGGLVASTLSLNNDDFMAGKYSFSNNGSAGSITNHGTLTAAQSGYIALLAPEVINEGVISATLGKVVLAAGDQVTLQLSQGSLLGFNLDKGTFKSLVDNKQLIEANGGQVFMSAKAADVITTAMVNNSGIIEAQGMVNVNGSISMVADVVSQLGSLNVSGQTGGSIAINARAIIDAGKALANGSAGNGGSVLYQTTDAIIQSAAASSQANGTASGGNITLQADNSLFSSAQISATGSTGGNIGMFGNRVVLAAAQLNASGNNQGGSILVGGDFHGDNAAVINAHTTIINGATNLKADGGHGKIAVWSDSQTDYFGNISADQAGTIEVSSKGTLKYAGTATAGRGGSLLLDPANIIIDAAAGPAAYALLDPHAAANNLFGYSTAVLGTTTLGEFTESGQIAVSSEGDSLVASNAGAAYLYDAKSGALLSTLYGTHVDDQIGYNGFTALSNGNYLVNSGTWNGDMGAVTWGNGTTGISGAVSASNSLVGTTANDQVGINGITALSNGNYLVNSSTWNGDMGAVTWGNGTIGISGAVSASNSLVGTTANDQVGINGITALSNGNYVVASSYWNGFRGAATWGSGNSGISGAVSASNSLVGTTANDFVGNASITALGNGNYVVASRNWNGFRGAATWGSGNSGISGTISASNSLVGSSVNDQIGSDDITALGNGNYVVASRNWNGFRGAATWGSGNSGTSGAVSASNSLVGTTGGDYVGINGITALSNGNYVVASSYWNDGRGAATWGSGNSGISGAVSASNSLIGTMAYDYVGIDGITALSNGNYAVASSDWNGGRGAATWGSGNSGISGAASASNSLVGTTGGDYVGYDGITALSNGNYVVASSDWNGGRGAATWGRGNSGISGAVSASNSLVGTTGGDYVSSDSITALSNGNYIVASSDWAGGKGAVTWGSGTSGISGGVSANNSLVGTTGGDSVGYNGITALSNGNYLTSNPYYADDSGQTLIGTPGNLDFAIATGQTMTFNASAISATLASGTSVTLQASNDITVNQDITVAGTSGGALTLEAGRNIILNSTISTANGNFTAIAGSANTGVIAAYRLAGTPAITFAYGAVINTGTGIETLLVTLPVVPDIPVVPVVPDIPIAPVAADAPTISSTTTAFTAAIAAKDADISDFSRPLRPASAKNASANKHTATRLINDGIQLPRNMLTSLKAPIANLQD